MRTTITHRWPLSVFLSAVVLLPGGRLLAEEPTPYYHRLQTWFESMLRSREELLRLERAGQQVRGLEPVVVSRMGYGEPAKRVRIRVHGAQELYLIVTGAPDVVRAAGTWGNAKLIDQHGRQTWACHVKGTEFYWGRHETDKNLHAGVNGSLSIAGQRFEHGIHMYAECAARIPLEGRYEWFEAWVGVDDWVKGPATVRFIIGGPGTFAREALWQQLKLDFSQEQPRREMKWEYEDRIWETDWQPGDFSELARRYAAASRRVPELQAQAQRLAESVVDLSGLQRARAIYLQSRRLDRALHRADSLNREGLRLAIEDLRRTFGRRYPRADQFLQQLAQLETELEKLLPRCRRDRRLQDLQRLAALVDRFDSLQRQALLANPLLDFDRLLVVQRKPDGDPRRVHGHYAKGYSLGEYLGLPRQSSKCNPNIARPIGWDNRIAILQPVRPDGRLQTLFRPSGEELVLDVDLNYDADRLLFSMPDPNGRWRIWELDIATGQMRRLPKDPHPLVDYYDPCYLPDGDIVFCSTAPFQGVPCNPGVIVGMLYRMSPDGSNVRQLCFEQDHDYCPSILNDGRVLYLRWDYTDTPHVWNRMLFAMNPDGTGQVEYYGNNSYWPNAIFYARAIPGHPTKIVGIVTGHHMGRVGELVIFDPAKGKKETAGVVQRIPGRGQPVEPEIEDKLTEHSWPKFLHPWPLSDKYFLVSCKPTPDDLWGIYLVDVFDNLVLIKQVEGYALMEPIPLKKRPRPPIIRGNGRVKSGEAFVHVLDAASGPGMKGIPRGAVKQLRIFTYHFAYRYQAGIRDRVGVDGPWEIKRVLGTVPVHEDGSAFFRIPAKIPISVQPLDADGRALALMRSWMTAMPGETLTCVGCHEQEKPTAPPNRLTRALTHGPDSIRPWLGPPRNFDFLHEVQPVLDKYCVGCHNGRTKVNGRLASPDLRRDQGFLYVYRHGDPKLRKVPAQRKDEVYGKHHGLFPPSYVELRRFVRVGGLESDLRLLNPMEFHASTSELVQMLEKGHYNVRLDDEAWSRLVTWIDLNAPCHGTWHQFTPIPKPADQRRLRVELRKKYQGGPTEDWDEPLPPAPHVEPVRPAPLPTKTAKTPTCEGWPFSPEEARRRQKSQLGPVTRTIELAEGVTMEFVRIPAGRFVMGSTEGEADESPPTVVEIRQPFWMSKHEVTNAQYALFDPQHDSRFEHRGSWIFGEPYLGWPLNRPEQPVVRVSWKEAMAFCRWLSDRLGTQVTLPTEAEWEYACRAGAATPFFFGDLNCDFGKWANMADRSIRKLADESWGPKPPDIVPRDDRFDDGCLVTAPVGSYRPNPWGLFDMHGNVAEWTRTLYRPYPYHEDDGRNAVVPTGRYVVRGGSWRDRPKRCRSAFRLAYRAYQKVFNVGFRVVCKRLPDDAELAVTDRN